MLAPLGEDRLRLGEGELVDERRVDAVEDAVAPADLAGVGGVADEPVHRGVPPPGRWCGGAFVAELLRDRARAEPLAGVEVEDAADDGRFHRVRNQYALFGREEVAERRSAAEPAALFRAAFDSGGDAVDDGGVLELGEHGQHLQHHPAGGRTGVERLRR